MNLPSDTPRLPKWIFLLGYLILVGAAWLIYDQAAHPMTGIPLAAVVVCAVAAVVVGVIPFVTDYARRQDETLDNRQRSLQALGITIAAAAEQISIAATGLQGISEAAQENLAKTEQGSKGVQEKMDELHALLATAKKNSADAVAKLESEAKRISAALAELEAAAARAAEAARRISVPPPSVPEVPPVISSRIVEIRPAVKASFAPFTDPGITAAPAAPPEPPPAPELDAASSPAPDAAAPAPAPAPRKRSPRKPPPPAPAHDLVLEAAPPAEPSPSAEPEPTEPAVSADGATRLIVTAYIGIGNRLFIRGEGPGLTWEKGVPLTFVSIGKWRWETNDATQPVRFRLYKNDEIECAALGERLVEPGAQQDLSASF